MHKNVAKGILSKARNSKAYQWLLGKDEISKRGGIKFTSHMLFPALTGAMGAYNVAMGSPLGSELGSTVLGNVGFFGGSALAKKLLPKKLGKTGWIPSLLGMALSMPMSEVGNKLGRKFPIYTYKGIRPQLEAGLSGLKPGE